MISRAAIAAISAGGRWRPDKATTGTLTGWYEIFDSLVTRVSGDASNVTNRIVGGANPLVQSVAGNRPTYSATAWNGALPGLTFDGTADIMTANGLASPLAGSDQPFTVIWLGQMLTLGSSGSIRSVWGFGNTADDNPLHDLRLPASTSGVMNSGRRDSAATSKLKDAATAITTSRAIHALIFDGTKTKLRTNSTLDTNLDGVHATTADNDVGALTGLNTLSVGAITRTGTSGFTHQVLAAMLVYQGALSNADCARAERYLTAGHPL